MFGWLQEGRTEAATVEAGWSGGMSLPRIATMDANGELAFAPVPEVESLRVSADGGVRLHQLDAWGWKGSSTHPGISFQGNRVLHNGPFAAEKGSCGAMDG